MEERNIKSVQYKTSDPETPFLKSAIMEIKKI